MGLASRWVSGKTGVTNAPPAPRTIRPPPPPLGEENTAPRVLALSPIFSHYLYPILGLWLGRPVCRVGHCRLLGVSFLHEPPPGLSFGVCFGAAPLASPCNLDVSQGSTVSPRLSVLTLSLSFDLSEHQSVLPSTHPSSPGSSSVTLPQTLYRRLPHNSPTSCIYPPPPRPGVSFAFLCLTFSRIL